VLGPDCRTPLPDVRLDAWQADASGNYHDERAQYRLRGQLTTNQSGRFELFTILPGAYEIGGGSRPAHIHVTVSRPGYRSLTTQLYFKGDPYLAPRDACGSACRSDDPDRIIDLRKEEKMGGEFLVGTVDIVLAREGS
jgi:protocatechuate 3,4-dioxygenase beta subunit